MKKITIALIILSVIFLTSSITYVAMSGYIREDVTFKYNLVSIDEKPIVVNETKITGLTVEQEYNLGFLNWLKSNKPILSSLLFILYKLWCNLWMKL